MHNAALGGHPELIRELAKHGTNINAPSRDGAQTPLHIAAAMGRLKAAEALMTLGANPTLQDFRGRTPLELAERAGLAAVATLLRTAAAAPRLTP